MVSIVIPNFNRASYLKQAVESVLKQTYKEWEILIVDDGSSDDSKIIIQEINDKRIHWIERSGNLKGASVCRNIGIQKAKGKYIVFLDSDDLLKEHCLGTRIKIMQSKTDLDFAVFKMQFFYENPDDDRHIWNIDNGENIIQRFLNLDAVWQTSGPIWKKEALVSIGMFNPNLQCWQDIDIHLKALSYKLNYKLFYDLPADCWYRKDASESISQSNTNSLIKLKSKRIFFEWVRTNTVLKPYNNLILILHILISALNGCQFRFFIKFYWDIKSKLPIHVRKNIMVMAFIKASRSFKLKPIQSFYDHLKGGLNLDQGSIGKYYV